MIPATAAARAAENWFHDCTGFWFRVLSVSNLILMPVLYNDVCEILETMRAFVWCSVHCPLDQLDQRVSVH